MFGIGLPELVIIIIIALIVLGPKKLPGIVTAVRKGVTEFRKALYSVGSDADSEQEQANKDDATDTSAEDIDSKKGGTA